MSLGAADRAGTIATSRRGGIESHRVRWSIGFGVAAVVLLVHPLAGSAGGRHPLAYTGALWRGLVERCGSAAAAPKPYPWPLRAFHPQHPGRGFFRAPRELLSSVGP